MTYYKIELNLNQLNREQKKAVVFNEGPLLIVAGAGTGKTTVITYRLANLIQTGKAKPNEILAVTFTDKAAEEMEERVDKLLPLGYVDLWISTFHSFAKRILEEHSLDIGLSNDFKIVDQTSAWLLIRQNLEKFDLDYYKPLANPTKFIHSLISHFSRCKDQAIYPEDYLKYKIPTKAALIGEEIELEEKRIQEVSRAYQVYQNLLLENNLLDFGDLINYCLELFQKRPKILKQYQDQFKYILVDEFQDTNWAQYQLVKFLAEPKNNLTVCADDNQAIYKFRGASFGNIIQFRKDFPQAKQIFLRNNYRSTQDILDIAYNFIQLNKNRLEDIDKIDEKLIADTKDKGVIEHLHFRTSEQEVNGVINKIIELRAKDKNATLNDFGILVRANNQANAFCAALERAEIPYQFMALRGLYSRPVILDIISYFKILDNYHESAAVYRILSLDFLKIPSKDIAKITQFSTKKVQSVFQTLTELALVPDLSDKAVGKINQLLILIKKHTKLAEQKNVSEVFINATRDLGCLEYLTKNNKIQEFNYLNQFYERIKKFEEENFDKRLRNFMEELNLELESGEQGKLSFDIEQGPEMVRLMTVHSAKGLEFKYVFLVNLVDKRFPSIERKEPIEIPDDLIKDIIPQGDIHLEEERRLFYVGMTRAKKGIFFTSAENYGGERKKKLSLFLSELGFSLPTLLPQLSEQVSAEIATPASGARISKSSNGNLGELFERNARLSQKAGSNVSIETPNYFSFTQLRAFDVCPYQYQFAHIYKVPVRGRAVFSYGKTIHNTLERFIKSIESDSRLRQKNLSSKKLIEIYKQEWIDDWYQSQEQKNKYLEAGKNALKIFYQDFLKTKPKILLINGQPAIEQNFNLKINSNTLIGKIDRIDKIISSSPGEEELVELIDYKTGTFKEKLEPDDKEQLLIYQMASEQVFNLRPEKLTYYYIDSGKKISFLGTKQDLEKQKQKILNEIKEIKKGEFLPKPGWHCQYCDFKDICQFAEK